MKLKLKPIKNKKVMFLFLALAAVLLLGIVFNLVRGISSEKDMCKVVINYNLVDSDGFSTRFDTYRAEHAVGERINITSPEKEGYSPDREKISTVVKTDLIFNVNYSCEHSSFTYSDMFYKEDGHYYTEVCSNCGYGYDICEGSHSFDCYYSYPDVDNDWNGYFCVYCYCGYEYYTYPVEKTATFTLGGTSLLGLTGSGTSANGYLAEAKKVVLLRSSTPQFDEVCSGVSDSNFYTGYFPYGDATLNKGIKIELEYDESVWGENAISFKYSRTDIADTPYSISCGDAWRFIFTVEDDSVSDCFEWLKSGDCPLITSPITIKVTTYTFD